MKRIVQKLIVAAVPFLVCCAFQARACDANFHLLLVSEWGATVDNISIRDTNGDYLISGETLETAQVIPYDLVITPGQVYHFYGHDTAYGQDFYVDFTPQNQEFLLDVIGYPFITQEWGDPISPPTTYTITTSNSPSGGGTTSGGGTKTCAATTTVTATPASGYAFVNWTEGGTVVANTTNYTFVVAANRTLVANFSVMPNPCPPNFHLQVTNNTSLTMLDLQVCDDNGNCLISAETLPAGESIGGDFIITPGQHLISTVHSADNEYNFQLNFNPSKQQGEIDIHQGSYSEWGDPINPPTTYTISTSSSPGAGGTTSGGGTVNCNSSVTITATPASCYTFVNWTEGGAVKSTSASYTFTATEDRTLVANFSPITYTISTSSSPTGGGTTSGGGTKSCGSTVTVTATPASGYAFVNWTAGGVQSTSASYTITANHNWTLVANFIRQYTITTSSSPSNGGTTSGGGIKNDGSSVTVTATPNSGYAFANWTEGGTEVGTTWPSLTFTANTNRTLVANFVPTAPTTVSVSAALADTWEGSGAPSFFTITRVSTNLTYLLPVSIQVSGTASNGVDYAPINSQVGIPAGASSVKVYVWPFQDNLAENTETVVLTLNSSSSYTLGSPSSATNFIHDDCASPLANPKSPGSYTIKTNKYDPSAPSNPAYRTSTVGIGIYTVPISGYVVAPTNGGPFPLVLIAHGSGFDPEGFRYLCASLASHGIIAASVGANYSTDYEGKVTLLRYHISQFATWNNTVGHPLYGRVDTNHIMLAGHSTMGGAVVLAASDYNGTVAGNPIKAVVGLDPVAVGPDLTALHIPTNNTPDNIFILLATHGGVNSFTFNPLYDNWISHDITNYSTNDAVGFRALTWIYGATHGSFSDDLPDPSAIISLEDQLNVIKVYVGAMAQAVLLGHPEYLKFLQDYRFAASDLPTNALCPSEYQPPSRSFIDHFELQTNNWLTPLSPYNLSATNIWNVANPTNGGIISPYKINDCSGCDIRSYGWFQWSDWSHYFQVLFSGQGLNASGYSHIALRISQRPTSLSSDTKYLKIVVQDMSGNSSSFSFALPAPDNYNPFYVYPWMQTVRIPLPGLSAAGVDINHIAFIRLAPEAPPLGSGTGSVVFDDIQLYNAPLSTPTIVIQPASQTKCVGSSVTFNVVASGSAPLSYQWKRNGVNIAGATSSSYTISSVTTGSAGNYTVVVSNPCGSVTSAAAVLTVSTSPTITTQPASQTVNVGSPVTFTVAAGGTTPLSYQWKFNGNNISGATSSSYTISSAATGNAGNYTVVVNNACGSATSATAILTVLTPPTITTVVGNHSLGGNYSGDGGSALSAGLSGPTGISFGPQGQLLIADTGNYNIRIVSGGTINSVPNPYYSFSTPLGVVLDGDGYYYVAEGDWGGLMKFQSLPNVTTIGNDYLPVISVAKDGSGNLYCVNAYGDTASLRTPDGDVTVVAGNGTQGYSGDGGSAISAQLFVGFDILYSLPSGHGVILTSATVDSQGNKYIADVGNNVVRKVNTSGIISTVAGNYDLGGGYSGDGGLAVNAQLSRPAAVAVDAQGNLYIADTGNHRVRRVDHLTGIITTVAGTGTAGYSGDSGAATSAQLNNPAGLVFDASGNLYISDTGNDVIRRVTLYP